MPMVAQEITWARVDSLPSGSKNSGAKTKAAAWA